MLHGASRVQKVVQYFFDQLYLSIDLPRNVGKSTKFSGSFIRVAGQYIDSISYLVQTFHDFSNMFA